MSGEHFASMESDDWGTPKAIVDLVHTAFEGPPQIDPCSSARHNERIKAVHWLGFEDRDPISGIPVGWGHHKTIFINPPGGCRPDKLNKKGDKWVGPSYASLFWESAQKALFGTCNRLIWVAYNINQLQTLSEWKNDFNLLQTSSVLVPSSRVKYVNREDKEQAGTPCASAILLFSLRKTDHLAFYDWNKANNFGSCWYQ